jgi:uncharacterized protein YndB with AHSA1/START domain
VSARHASRQSSDDRGATVTLPSDTEILIVREFAAPREVIFDAWTRPEHVAQWWDPSGAPLAACDIDLRPDGVFRFVPRGPQPPFSGAYRAIVPPERLVFATVVAPSGAESIGTLLFEEHDGRTRLRLTIACASRADRDALLEMRVADGTVQTLKNLSAYAARLTGQRQSARSSTRGKDPKIS